MGLFAALRLLSEVVFLVLPAALLAGALWLRRRRRLSRGFALAALLLLAVGVDAFFVEPSWLAISRVEVMSPKVKRRIRVAVVADLQMESLGSHERQALQRVQAERPDLILFAGDYVQTPSYEAVRDQLRSFIGELGLSAPMGIYAVRGNIDREDWISIFDRIQVHTFDETSDVDVGELRITGLSRNDSFSQALQVGPSERFHLVLGHSPNFALGRVEADLLVAGHTHGGQVRLPWVGPLLTLSSVPRAWAAGATRLDAGRTLVVARGVGMERGDAPQLRFLCRPEIVIVEIIPGPGPA
jgi:predicted MPP superfamily phosphohydrolase